MNPFRSTMNLLSLLMALMSLTTTVFVHGFHPMMTPHPLSSRTTVRMSPSCVTTILKMASEGGPAVLDRPETIVEIDKEEKTEQKEGLGSEGWEIRLFNDPWNKREFVARCLATICGKTDTESYQIMMQAHNDGMGVVGRYMFEVAELYYNSLQENGLSVDMVPVEDE